MCGIAGSYWKSSDLQSNIRMERALQIMRERGPNHQDYRRHDIAGGSALLGQTRLSVIDLSEQASQPMYSPDGRYGLIFNGEIYNYIELREELARYGRNFHTQSDTEVLLAAWEAWGQATLRRLTGMFAFAVFDFQLRTCTLVRDAFGIKPLFYASTGEGFYFASDTRAMRALAPSSPTLNWQRAYDYLVHGEYDFGNETFFNEFSSLSPGHLIEVALDQTRAMLPRCWWKPSIAKDSTSSFDEASMQLRELLLESVKLHLRSDVPLGAALSGGIDSSVIVCAMREIEPDLPIHTFSFVASESAVSEEHWVDLVNKHVGAIAHKVHVTPEELAHDLESLIDTQGEPFGSTSIYAQYRVFKLAQQNGVTVTLDGQGADEMMGGYNGYPGQRLLSLLDKGAYVQALTFLRNWAAWPGRSPIEGLKRLVGAGSSGRFNSILRRLNGMQNTPDWIRPGPLREAGVHLSYPQAQPITPNQGRRMMAFLAQSLTERGLLGLLRHGDRNSMRFSVESRVPFLTTGLVEFMLRQPEEYLVSPSGETKALLRASMRGIVPDAVLDRRDKIGFATPEKAWMFSMASTVRQWLADDTGLPFLDQAAICEHFEQILAGKRPYTWQVWRWINFIRWYKGLN
ncbi:asparagine synthase (glutamine-hydrolyzing) [Herbaspirillum camelliae]|uniref:asparagine synthase (glutamine-hydrolyzing) n=1 Tax=Herbaspirillum camelliae TaxID=1892903 RepID=UPI000949CBA2|nr:asparagine synthase (glutamine-hydrolyzing) [Herbaspirillum camelliae]